MKSVKIFGKSISVLAIVGIISMGMVSAALLDYYGRITADVEVQQAVLLDGVDYNYGDISETPSGAPGIICGDTHNLRNNADVKIIVSLDSEITGAPGGDNEGLTVNPEYKLDATVDDDAFFVVLGSSITWGNFSGHSFDYLIESDGGNLWIPQMNLALRDGSGDVKYLASWHSFRTGMTGTVGERTGMTFNKDDFYIYRTNWHLLGLWSDAQWYKEYVTTPTDLLNIGETNALKAEIDLLQFSYFTRQAGDTSIDDNPTEAQQIVWLSNLAIPTRSVIGIGLPTTDYDPALQIVEFRMVYNLAYDIEPGTYTVETEVNYVGTL